MIPKRVRPTGEGRPSEEGDWVARRELAGRLDDCNNGWDWLVGFLLVAATLLAYWPALQGEFFFDDAVWTTDIEKLLRDGSGLREIWLRPTALQQYYPLTGTSFWIDYQLWHWWTLPYHVENVLLHAGSAILLWRLLRKLEVPGALLAGALFALHPIMVESTAWITERKNVLSMFLFLASLLAYGRFTGFWREDPPARSRAGYVLGLLLFIGALLSKITAFALPAVILLLCWWKRGRIRWRDDVLPTLPFFALSVGLGLWVSWLEKHHVGARGADWDLSWAERILVAGRVSWFYAGKLLWPLHPCFVYPKWQLDTASFSQWLYPLSALVVLLAPWLLRGRIGRGPATAVFYVAGTLFPVLGFLNFYWTVFSYVGDHLVYLSSIGVVALEAAVVARAAAHLRRPVLLQGFAALVLPLFAVLTWREAGQYRDAETMWRSVIARNPDCWLACNNLASTLLQSTDQTAEALALCERASAMKPDFPEAHYNLGVAFQQMGRVDDEIGEYRKALDLKPAYLEAHLNLGQALVAKGQLDEAMAHYLRILELAPDEPKAHYNLGNVLLQKGQVDPAIARYERALEIKPDYAQAHYNLGNACLQKKQAARAIAHYQKALEINPKYAMAHMNLGAVFLQEGRDREAIGHYESAIKINPGELGALSNLAWLLATSSEVSVRDGARALDLAQQASQLSGGNHPTVLHTLAAAYAENGRFPEAAQTAERALELATAQGNSTLAEVIRGERSLYLAGQPVRAK